MLDAAKLAGLIRRGRYRQGNEFQIHDDLEAHLTQHSVPFEREVRLSDRNRIDFLCGDVGIECKARAKRRELFRQLERYAQEDQISALILLTGTATGLPPEINGKPVYLVSLGRTSL
ncbi:hypothetical protein GRI39_01840 [Altererythrobacter indicus]|uniref:DUF4143 domain-containing protein n=1 Tax=Altericroceibacterium indicum TaxID=374177 RepID=A0A845A5F1_9SPHN|nr:hypothetical protein [Altericroceibacterium indicum]